MIMDESGADSPQFVNLGLDLEKQFKIKIRVDESAQLITVADVISFIESKQG
jgi:acyl carrier protein